MIITRRRRISTRGINIIIIITIRIIIQKTRKKKDNRHTIRQNQNKHLAEQA